MHPSERRLDCFDWFLGLMTDKELEYALAHKQVPVDQVIQRIKATPDAERFMSLDFEVVSPIYGALDDWTLERTEAERERRQRQRENVTELAMARARIRQLESELGDLKAQIKTGRWSSYGTIGSLILTAIAVFVAGKWL